MIQEKKYYSAEEISKYVNKEKSYIRKVISKKLKQNHVSKNNKEYLYSEQTFSDVIKFFEMLPDNKTMYIPFRIETVYHIYESKMNFLPDSLL